VRCDRSVVLVEISTAALATSPLDSAIARIVSYSRSSAVLKVSLTSR
jgi:hypothetical protein